jgi:hypothetical protein
MERRDQAMKTISPDEAKKLKHGQVVCHMTAKNADGTPQRWRVNGKVKTWKRNEWRFLVPLKRGLHEYTYLTPFNMHQFTLDGVSAFLYANIKPPANRVKAEFISTPRAHTIFMKRRTRHEKRWGETLRGRSTGAPGRATKPS